MPFRHSDAPAPYHSRPAAPGRIPAPRRCASVLTGGAARCLAALLLGAGSWACGTAPEPAETELTIDSAAASATDTVIPTPADTVPASARDSAADTTALLQLRSDIAELVASVDAIRRSTDSLRLALESTAGPPSVQADSLEERPISGTELLQDAGESARNYGLRAFWALIVLILTFHAIRIVVYALDRLAERSTQRRLFFKRLVPVVRILFWSVAVVFVIRQIFDVTAQGLLAAFAAIGVAVGFAAQDLIKNFFGGLVIVFDQPFQVGDKIEVAGTYGEVVSIGLRSTRIVTPDDSMVSVPNAQVVDSQVSNANSGALDCQVVTDLYLPGWVDEAAAKAIAHQVAASSRYVYLGKPITVLVRDEFRETFITHLKVKAYVVDARHEFAFMSDVTERARAEFRRRGLLRPLHGARAWVDITGLRQTGDGEHDG